MGWYKIDIRHGGGHQSHTVKYRWFDGRADDAEKREMFEDIVRDQFMHDAIGDVTAVRRLPAKIRDEKVAGYKRAVEHNKTMLKRLGAL